MAIPKRSRLFMKDFTELQYRLYPFMMKAEMKSVSLNPVKQSD